ncbi:MAG: CRISPR-associated RAMP protein Csx7 [Candidatus Nitrosocaldaceae archaeon]
MNDFSRLEVEYEFVTTLINESPLSIGSGRSLESYSDNPIVRLGREPYIPASSIKGVLRNEAEKYARALSYYVCDIFDKVNGELELKKNKNDYTPCTICSIFGGPTIASSVYINNAILKSKEDRLVESVRKVSISRVVGAQFSGRLYDLEYLIPYQEFDWSMKVVNLDILKDSKESNIIKYLINKMIKYGIAVGGRKSIGFGKVKIKKFELKRYSLADNGKLVENDATNDYKRLLDIE